jgi:HK97 family phage portal protein
MTGLLDIFLGPPGSGWVNKGILDDYWYTQRGQATTAGVTVSEELSLTYATVFACVSKLAKTIATLPAAVMEKTSNDERRVVQGHPLNRILQVEANPDCGAVTWREMMMVHLLLWGKWYAKEVYDRNMNLVELRPRLTQYMQPRIDRSGKLYFEYTPPDEPKDAYPSEQLLQIHGMSLNGVTGVSVIGLHRETIALGLAASKFASAFYGKGAWMGGWLKQTDGQKPVSPEKQREHLALINERFQGAGKAFGLGFLAAGLDYVPITGMPLKDAEFLASRQFTRTEVCGIFDVPPSKIHDDTRSTFSNVEQKNIDWSTDSILPWCIRIEMALNRRYFPDGRMYVKHNLSSLVRGDIKTRYEAYAIGRQWGWLSANDVRAREDMNPIDGGDNYLIPINMAVLRDGEVVPISQPKQDSATPGNAVRPDSFAGLFLDAASQVVTKECHAIEKAWKKHAKDPTADAFLAWADKFYGEHEEYFVEKFRSPLETAFDLLGIGEVEVKLAGLARSYVAGNRGKLLAAVETGSVPELVAEWKAGRVDSLVRQITSVASVLPAAA